MMRGIWTKYIGLIAIGSGVIGALIYLIMINVTLAHIEAVSGQTPFDMRPLGYSPADAAALLNALGTDGSEYYLRYQIPLDTLYPAMLALTLIAAISRFGQRMPNSKLVRLGIALSLGAALFDYGENLGIVAMIRAWPDTSDMLVYAVSIATIVKSVLTTLSVSLVLVVGFFWSRLSKAEVHP